MIAGTFQGKAVLEGRKKFEITKVVKDGRTILKVRGDMIVVGGQNDGETSSYDGKFDEKSIRWTKRDLMALGWQGVTLKTLIDDITKAAKTVTFEAEIATYNDRKWSAVRSIGYAPAPSEPITAADVHEPRLRQPYGCAVAREHLGSVTRASHSHADRCDDVEHPSRDGDERDADTSLPADAYAHVRPSIVP